MLVAKEIVKSSVAILADELASCIAPCARPHPRHARFTRCVARCADSTCARLNIRDSAHRALNSTLALFRCR